MALDQARAIRSVLGRPGSVAVRNGRMAFARLVLADVAEADARGGDARPVEVNVRTRPAWPTHPRPPTWKPPQVVASIRLKRPRRNAHIGRRCWSIGVFVAPAPAR